jgi:hypothetical protein
MIGYALVIQAFLSYKSENTRHEESGFNFIYPTMGKRLFLCFIPVILTFIYWRYESIVAKSFTLQIYIYIFVSVYHIKILEIKVVAFR